MRSEYGTRSKAHTSASSAKSGYSLPMMRSSRWMPMVAPSSKTSAGPSVGPGRRRLAHDPEKCVAVFRKDHAQNKNPERDDDSSRSWNYRLLALRPWPDEDAVALNSSIRDRKRL